MENRTRKILALTIVVSMLLVGCTGEPSADSDEKGADEIEQPPIRQTTVPRFRKTRLLKSGAVNSATIPITYTACFHFLQVPSWT